MSKDLVKHMLFSIVSSIAIVAVVIILITIVSPVESDAVNIDGVEYELTLSDAGVEKCTCSGNVSILSSVEYSGRTYPVTYIRENAFQFCTSLTSVEMPKSITSIGSSAFNGCSSLKSINISSNVSVISENTFYGCSSLEEITIPEKVTSICRYAFCGCSSLKEIEIPDSVITIGEIAFASCSSVTSINVGDGVTTIGSDAFSDCTCLQRISLPAKLTNLGENALFNCPSLSEINVAKGNANYCSISGVLYNHDVTKLIQYPIGKTSASYVLPDSVTSIGERAFYNCSSLAAITFGTGLSEVGSEAFQWCFTIVEVCNNSSLSLKNGECGLTTYYVLNEYSSSKGSSILNYQSLDDSSTAIYVVKDSRTYLVKIDNIKNDVILPNTLGGNTYDIYANTFFRCLSLESIVIPNGVTTIGEYAFSESSNLSSVVIGEDVTTIELFAFEKCTSLTSLTITDNVTSIGDSAFSLGSHEKSVLCEVSGCTSGKLDEFVDSRTSFIYVPLSYIISYDVDEGSISIGPESCSGTHVLKSYDGVKSGYTFGGWSDGVSEYSPGDTVTIVKNTTFTAVWTPNVYDVIFMNEGDVYSTTSLSYGSVITVPTDVPTKQSTVQYCYAFDHWDGYIENMTVEGNTTFNAIFNESLRKYCITFISDGEEKKYGELEYGSIISAPITDPDREPTSEYKYVFSYWNGFTKGMTVSGDASFEAVFTAILVDINSSGDNITIKISDVDNVKASADVIEKIKKAGSEGKSTEISLSKGRIILDGGSAAGLPLEDTNISMENADRTVVPSVLKSKIGDRPIFSINLGDIHEFDGMLTISVNYTLKSGEDPNKVCIWYLKDDGSYEKISCKYSDGYATFLTSHLSNYAVMIDDSEAAVSESTTSNESGNNTGLIIGAIVAVVLIIALVIFLMIRGKHKQI